MNLLDQFVAGDVIVRIHSNEEANRLMAWVRENVEDASPDPPWYDRDEYKVYSETVVERRSFGDHTMLLNGYSPGLIKRNIKIDYAELLPYLDGAAEPDTDIEFNLEEVL